MSFLTTFLSPFNLLFFIIIAGFAIGKIRIKGISLGIAGVLFVSIFIGFLMNLLSSETNPDLVSNAQSTMKTFSKLGTSLFVSVIGLQTGFSIKNNSRESMLSFAIGSMMSISGAVITLLISILDRSISFASLLGILCGALTSTPALSSACEMVIYGKEEVVWGYGCSYLLGVIIVVFFTQMLSRNTDKKDYEKISSENVKSKIYPEFMLISLVSLLGNIFGDVKITSLNLSLGATASTLTVGLVIGYVVKRTDLDKISSQCLNVFRNLGLALFFTGTGVSTGMQKMTFELKTVLYGVVITLTATLCGWIFCKIVSARYPLHKGFIIAGGMTSSPAYGAITSSASKLSANCFSFSYFGALISLLTALQIIAR